MTIPSAMIQLFEKERLAQEAHHQAYEAHAGRVAATFDAALAAEPGLRCSEWERRNPFIILQITGYIEEDWSVMEPRHHAFPTRGLERLHNSHVVRPARIELCSKIEPALLPIK